MQPRGAEGSRWFINPLSIPIAGTTNANMAAATKRFNSGATEMAKVNYITRLKSSWPQAACLHSVVCAVCFRSGARVPFFGVSPDGAVIMGVRPQDQKFRKAIWTAAQKHMREEHNMEFISNGHVDGYRLKTIKEGENRGN